MNRSKYARLKPLTQEEIDEREVQLDVDAQHHEGEAEKLALQKKGHDNAAEALIGRLRKLVRNRSSGKPVYLLADEETTTEVPDETGDLPFREDAAHRTDAKGSKGEKVIDAEARPSGPLALPSGDSLPKDNGNVYEAKRAGKSAVVHQLQSGGSWYVAIDGARAAKAHTTSSEAIKAAEKALGGRPKKWATKKRKGPEWPSAPKASKAKAGKKADAKKGGAKPPPALPPGDAPASPPPEAPKPPEAPEGT